MQKKISTSKIVVYTLIGVVVTSILIAAAVYLPGLMLALHGG